MMQEGPIHNFWISNGSIIKNRESTVLTPFFMCKNYASFSCYFVIITFAALSGKFLLFEKPRLCVFILPHVLLLFAFVLSFGLSCEAKLLTKP